RRLPARGSPRPPPRFRGSSPEPLSAVPRSRGPPAPSGGRTKKLSSGGGFWSSERRNPYLLRRLLQRMIRREPLNQPVLDLKTAEEPGPRRPLLFARPPRELGAQHDPVQVVEPDLHLGGIPAPRQLLLE